MPSEPILSQAEFDDCLIHGTMQDQRRLHSHNRALRAALATAQETDGYNRERIKSLVEKCDGLEDRATFD